jgi:hypothetical protein
MNEKRMFWFCLTMITVSLICTSGMVLTAAILANVLRQQSQPYPLFIQRGPESIGYPGPVPAPALAEPIGEPRAKE